MQSSIEATLNELGKAYYQVVPVEYRTFCSFTAQATSLALRELGFSSQLLQCQVLYGYPKGNLAVGFTDQEKPGKWNGHVVCTCEGWLIDAATSHLRAAEPLVPDLVITRLLPTWSSALAKKSIDEQRSILWLRPPPGKWQPMPAEPADIVTREGRALAAAVRQGLGA